MTTEIKLTSLEKTLLDFIGNKISDSGWVNAQAFLWPKGGESVSRDAAYIRVPAWIGHDNGNVPSGRRSYLSLMGYLHTITYASKPERRKRTLKFTTTWVRLHEAIASLVTQKLLVPKIAFKEFGGKEAYAYKLGEEAYLEYCAQSDRAKAAAFEKLRASKAAKDVGKKPSILSLTVEEIKTIISPIVAGLDLKHRGDLRSMPHQRLAYLRHLNPIQIGVFRDLLPSVEETCYYPDCAPHLPGSILNPKRFVIFEADLLFRLLDLFDNPDRYWNALEDAHGRPTLLRASERPAVKEINALLESLEQRGESVSLLPLED